MINISDTQQLKTSVTYYGTGSQTNFDFPFDYLRKAFIHVTINDVEVSDYSIDSRTIIFETAPSEGAIINIYRSTDTTRLVAWADASVLKASDMTISQVQQLHILEEGQDWSKLNSIYLDENDSKWQGNNHPMKNISDPIDAKDVVTKGYMETVQGGFVMTNTALKDEAAKQAGIATTKASEASMSASAAKTSETNAASSANIAKRWAEASDSPDNTTSKSAKTWASEAAGSASAAKTSETKAKTSETKAKSSETNAVNSATTATEKASVATTKASEAAGSASAAKTSETNAASSATNAQNAATHAEVQAESVKKYKALWFDSVAAMKAEPSLTAGAYVCTAGYYEPNDGGASYLIRAKTETDVDDGGSLHELQNGLVAELIVENGTVNVKQFGAKGDGVSDDSIALQASINYCSNNQVPLSFSNGTYIVNETITLQNAKNFKMYGFSVRQYFNQQDSCTIKQGENFEGSSVLNFINCNNTTIKNIALTGINKSINGIKFTGGAKVVIEECNICYFINGVYFDYCGYLLVTKNNVGGCNCAIFGVGAGDSQFTDNFINTNMKNEITYDPMAGTGIALVDGSNHVNISGGKIEWNDHGIFVLGSSGITISNINFDYNRSEHIVVHSSTKYSLDGICITGNYFRSGGQYGKKSHIFINGNENNIKASITGNVFSRNTASMGSSSNPDENIVCPLASVIRIEHVDTDFVTRIVVSGNNMQDGSELNDYWVDGYNTFVYDYGNKSNLSTYVVSTSKLIKKKNWDIVRAQKDVTLTYDTDNQIYLGSLTIDLDQYLNAKIIPLGAANPLDLRFSTVNFCVDDNKVYFSSTKLSSIVFKYLILYTQE